MKAGWFYIICVLFGNAGLAQQFPNIQFNYLTEKEGLSNNEVDYISQDSEGFIWIGTVDGLNRYDGYRVKHFFHSPANENSLVNNCVFNVVPDNKDHLWITTREGLSIYDKRNGVFHNFRHNPADSSSIDNDQYNTVYTDGNNSAWVSTLSAVYRFDSSLHYKKVATGIQNLLDFDQKGIESYQGIARDREGQLWASGFQYLFRIDSSTMAVTKTFGPFSGNILTIYEDSHHQYWIGSFGGGFMSFDPNTGKAVTIKLSTASIVISSVTEWWDWHHKRWLVLGTDGGIVLVDPVSLQSKEYTFHSGYFPEQILARNSVHHVFVDRQNVLWIGTEAGVCYAMPSRQLFDLWNISGSSGTLPTSISDWIYSFCQVSNGYWMTRWIGPGLYYFNQEGILKKTIDTVQIKEQRVALSDSLKPYYIMNQGDTILWITTNKYLIHYDLRSKRAILYKPPDAEPLTGLRTITEINDHSWWIRTRNNGQNGIYIFNPLTGTFIKHYTYSPGCSNCVPPKLLTLYLSSKKEMYVTAVGEGLFKYDPISDGFISLFKFQNEDLRQHSNSFESIAEDKNGILWIASYTGVFIFDPISKKIVRDYTQDEQTGGVEASGIIFDEQQNAWISTERGIFYILHSSGQLRPMINTEGLANNSNGIFRKGKDHSIYSGILGHLVHFFPSELLSRPAQNASVHFSEATIMDSSSFFHVTASGQKELLIEPGQNRFSLDFSVMNYDGGNRYYYRVDGLTNNWQENENGHLAFYNLSPGRYNLHVRGGNKYGDPMSNEDEVTIIVQPHWWQTVAFRLFLVVAVITLTAFLLRRRIIHIRHEASFKQKIAETEMSALRSQMNPHFIFNSLNSIENFIMQNEKRLASSYLNKFARLIRIILDSSRNELVPLSKDLEALRLYVDLEQLRFNHKFSFNVHVDPSLLNGDYKVPPLLIQPYVENAIVHGLAHSEKDDLSLYVSVFPEEDYIHYTVQDNGVGRKLSFHYNLQNKPRHKSVGLAITEERIHIFNQKQHAKGQVMITDLFDENHQPSGTKVDILIKAV
ncbi:MAG TPA: two-component regulator propeller domain-containing protein [Chitinophagaceae bacterium]